MQRKSEISRRVLAMARGHRNAQLSDLVASESTSVLFQNETSKGTSIKDARFGTVPRIA